MQSIHQSILLPYNASDMFHLIDQVEDYPQFLPWCNGVVIHEHTDILTDATIQVSYLGLKTEFRTRNTNIAPKSIDMHFVEGPFRALTGCWEIIALSENACKITFSLEYAFSSTLLEKLIGPVFGKITTTFVDAFVKEAEKRFT